MSKDQDPRMLSERHVPLEYLTLNEIFDILYQKTHPVENGESRERGELVDETRHVKYLLFGGTERYEHQHSSFEIIRAVRAENTCYIPSISAQFLLFEPVVLSNGKRLIVPSNKITIMCAGLQNSPNTYREYVYTGTPQNGYWAEPTQLKRERSMEADSFVKPTPTDIEMLSAFGVFRDNERPGFIHTKKTAFNLVRNILAEDFAFPEIEVAWD